MFRKNIYRILAGGLFCLAFSACKLPALTQRDENKTVPASYGQSTDSTNTAAMQWRSYFSDPNLLALIDTALKNNQEINIIGQEIEITRNEVQARKGEYLPFVGLKAGAGVDKVARYTSRGAMEATTDIKPGKEMPDPLPDFLFGAYATWEIDIWHKLHNAQKAAARGTCPASKDVILRSPTWWLKLRMPITNCWRSITSSTSCTRTSISRPMRWRS
ncbi:MAG: TolC family protein [Flavihumibacter sp.]